MKGSEIAKYLYDLCSDFAKNGEECNYSITLCEKYFFALADHLASLHLAPLDPYRPPISEVTLITLNSPYGVIEVQCQRKVEEMK